MQGQTVQVDVQQVKATGCYTELLASCFASSSTADLLRSHADQCVQIVRRNQDVAQGTEVLASSTIVPFVALLAGRAGYEIPKRSTKVG